MFQKDPGHHYYPKFLTNNDSALTTFELRQSCKRPPTSRYLVRPGDYDAPILVFAEVLHRRGTDIHLWSLSLDRTRGLITPYLTKTLWNFKAYGGASVLPGTYQETPVTNQTKTRVISPETYGVIPSLLHVYGVVPCVNK